MASVADGIPADVLTLVARRVLLDALEALAAQLDAITLVGAQAVHLRSGGGELTAPSYTSDADLGIDPTVLDDEPLLEQLMTSAGFTQGPNPGHWRRPERVGSQVEDIVVDLMVADTFSGPGSRRSGVIPPHSRDATRRTPGLEPAAVDYDVLPVPSLEPEADPRVIDVRVAGPAALLVAKACKLGERFRATGQRRLVQQRRSRRAAPHADQRGRPRPAPVRGLACQLPCRDDDSSGSDLPGRTVRGVGEPVPGVTMAVEALRTEVDADQIEVTAPAYTAALLRVVR